MKKENKEMITNGGKVLTYILAVLTIIPAFGIVVLSLWVDDLELRLRLAASAYAAFLCVMVIVLVNSERGDYKFKDVSFYSFFEFVLFIPFLLWVVMYVPNLFNWFGLKEDVIRVCVIFSQIIVILVWFGPKLTKKKWIVEDLMKLDLYSTMAIFPLTIIWVLYKISPIAWGFAFVMGEFLVIQMVVKYALINLNVKKNAVEQHE